MSQAALPDFHHVGRHKEAPSDHVSSWEGYKTGQIGVDSANRPYVCVRISERIDADILERAIATVIARHDILKSKVVERAGQPWLVCVPRMNLSLETYDLNGPARREERVQEFLTELVWKPFNLRTGNLFRTALVRIGSKDHIFLLILHHFIGDAVSSALLFREIRFAYDSLLAGDTPAFPPRPLQYLEYLAVLQDWYKSPQAKPHLDFWHDRFKGYVPPAAIEAVNHGKMLTKPVKFGKSLSTDLVALGRNEKVSSFVVLLAAQKVLLSHLTGSQDITVAAVTDGRDLPVLRGVVGYFADRTYYRTDLSGNPTFRDTLRRVQSTVQEASRHPFVRFDIFQKAAEQTISAPVFNFRISSSKRRTPIDSWKPYKLGPAPSVTRPGFSVCYYWLELAERPRGITGHLRFKGGAIPRFTENLRDVLCKASEEPKRRLRNLLSS